MRRIRLAVFVHLVWATWDRLPLITIPIQQEIYRAIGAKCEELHAELIALGGVEDHVHLLVRMPSTISIAEFSGQVKGPHRTLSPTYSVQLPSSSGRVLMPASPLASPTSPKSVTTSIANVNITRLAPLFPRWSCQHRMLWMLRSSQRLQPAQAGFVATGLQARLQAPA